MEHNTAVYQVPAKCQLSATEPAKGTWWTTQLTSYVHLFMSVFLGISKLQNVRQYYQTDSDSVFRKRILTYWENRGTPHYSQMNGFMVGIENYIFFERGKPHFPKNV